MYISRAKQLDIEALERYANDPAYQPPKVVHTLREIMLGTVLLCIILITTTVITAAKF